MPEHPSPSSETGPLGEGLVHEESLCLRFSAISQLPDPQTQTQCNEHNERFLRGLGAIEEHHESGDDAEGLHPELMRLDMKLSLLMDLVGELLTRQAGLPAPTPVRFNGRGMTWRSDLDMTRGDLLAIDLYLHESLPRPLRLFGEVVSTQATPEGATITLSFIGMSEMVRDLLEKYIFRAHRRQIARQRGEKGR